MNSNVKLGDLDSRNLPDAVPFALVTPPGYEASTPLPLCLMLMGGGGSRQNLIDCQPLLDAWWTEGSIPPMVFATPSAGMSYYLEDPQEGVRWESFLTEEFVPHLRSSCNIGRDRRSTAITGISMGGYGALKTAFARPDFFGVVAAMQPILEPGFHDADIGARNRLHHSAGGPARLIGSNRDAALFEANSPANIARDRAVLIKEAGLAIYIQVGDHDFVNAHDGTEFLHRVLWDLDLSHEYHLIRGGDHGGPGMHAGMRAMYMWVGSALKALRADAAAPTAEDLAVGAWIQSGMSGNPPAVAPVTNAFLRMVRAQLQPVRDRAAAIDSTTNRTYGLLRDHYRS